MANLEELQAKLETKIKALNLDVRENHHIINKDKEEELQKHLQLFEKRFEEIHEMKSKVQEMMIENNANEETIDRWIAKLDEKLEKMEQSIADKEESIKNWERRKSIEEKNQEEQRLERRIREEQQIEEMR